MATPQYLIDKKAEKFDNLLSRAHRRSYDFPNIGLELITNAYRKLVRYLRKSDRRKST